MKRKCKNCSIEDDEREDGIDVKGTRVITIKIDLTDEQLFWKKYRCEFAFIVKQNYLTLPYNAHSPSQNIPSQ